MAANSSTYKTSAAEFCKRAVALYKLKIFPRMGAEFAAKLYSSAIEAGARISALGDITDAECKLSVASDAIVKLGEVVFACNAMAEGGFYTAQEVSPVCTYAEKLTAALVKLTESLRQKISPIHGESRVKPKRREAKPAPAAVIAERTSEEILKEAEEEMNMAGGDAAQVTQIQPEEAVPVIQSGDNSDPDGFNAPFKNNE